MREPPSPIASDEAREHLRAILDDDLFLGDSAESRLRRGVMEHLFSSWESNRTAVMTAEAIAGHLGLPLDAENKKRSTVRIRHTVEAIRKKFLPEYYAQNFAALLQFELPIRRRAYRLRIKRTTVPTLEPPPQIQVSSESGPLLRIHAKREDANAEICRIVGERPARVQSIDLLQVSGQTAVAVLKAVAHKNPDALIRLLLMDKGRASRYDGDMEEGAFHHNRIRTTVGELLLLGRQYPNLSAGVKYYDTEPGISGISIDDWLVSVGWSPVYRELDSREIIRVRGHDSPALIALDKSVEPLLSMVRAQFAVIWATASPVWAPDSPEIRFGPKSRTSEMAWGDGN